jgi:hypothetical protein
LFVAAWHPPSSIAANKMVMFRKNDWFIGSSSAG